MTLRVAVIALQLVMLVLLGYSLAWSQQHERRHDQGEDLMKAHEARHDQLQDSVQNAVAEILEATGKGAAK